MRDVHQEPPPFNRCYQVRNEHADTHRRVGALVNIIDTSDDPDLRQRYYVLRFADGDEGSFWRNELEQVYV